MGSPRGLGPTRSRAGTALASAVLAAAIAVVVASCTSGGQTVATTTTGPTTTTVPETTTTTEPPMDSGRQLFVYNPEAGQCFDVREIASGASVGVTSNATLRNDDQVILLLDCAIPHQYEVAGIVEVPLPGAHPGGEELVRQAQRLCPPLFAAHVGQPYERSALEMAWLLPTPDEWGRGKRTIACLVSDPASGRLTGTAQGSRR
jgi:hypothetical protein